LLDSNVGNAATRAACSEYPQLIPTATLNPTAFFGDAAPVQKLQADGFRLVRFFPALQEWPIAYQPFGSLLEILAEFSLPVMVNVIAPGQITAVESFVGSYPTIIFSGVDPLLLPEAIAALRKKGDWMLETSRLTAIGSIKQVVDCVGAERLLFGTGAPAQSLSGALSALKHAGITNAERLQILSENAGRIL
jgi:predicted TIM-barrel fold metal-dependent hydrolase